MTINPFLKELLEKWGRINRNRKAWYTECPYFKEHIGRATRTPIFSEETDDIELLGLRISKMATPLRRSLEARFKHPFKTDWARANWCRCVKKEYYAHLNEAVKKLEDWLEIKEAS